jgi:SAM-dependent methyltransferase
MSKNNVNFSTLGVVKAHEPIFSSGLTTPENFSFELVPTSRRHSVLDIGVGAGRTIDPLSTMFDKYVGIDFSEKAIAKAKELFPHADLRVMDARNLGFAETFDCVVFSFNGIDCVNFADRELILRQIWRVLKPGGILIYSTHNLNHSRAAVWKSHFLVRELFSYRPLTAIRLIKNRLILFWHQSQDDKHSVAYINDPALSFTILNTYVDLPKEIERLREFGFSELATIGNTKAAAGYDDDDCWVYIVARNKLSD